MGRILTPFLLLCVACVGGRTPLADADATVAASTSGGDDLSSWDGGLLTSTPGRVRCGSIICGVGYKCCLRKEGRPASNGCARLEDTCHGPRGRVCDETTDCAPGEICCLGLVSSPPPTIGSRCATSTEGEASCGRSEIVACGSDDDCRAVGASCVAQRCRADILQSCGRMPSASCPP